MRSPHDPHCVSPESVVPGWLEIAVGVPFVATDWAGTALLIAGAKLNLVDMQRWRRTQAAGLRALAAA